MIKDDGWHLITNLETDQAGRYDKYPISRHHYNLEKHTKCKLEKIFTAYLKNYKTSCIEI